MPLERKKALSGRRGQGPQGFWKLSHSGDVLSLIAFRALADLEFDHLAFVECLIAVHLDGGEVHKHVFARLALNETVAL